LVVAKFAMPVADPDAATDQDDGKLPSHKSGIRPVSSGNCRDPIQSARGIQIGDGPLAAHAANHPSQDLPEIEIDHLLVEWLQCPDESIDLQPRWGTARRYDR
jgi:hypothetical protein